VFKFIFLCLCLICIQDNKEVVISWNKNYKLIWQDFRGTPEKNNDAVAITASGITFGFSIKTRNNDVVDYNTSIEAHFYPNKSWFKPLKANNYVLAHEQLHFDITELYARKFRKRVNALKISNKLKSQLRIIHKEIKIELTQFQEKYDRETNHSMNKVAQMYWQKWVTLELKKLEQFKSN